MCRYFLRLGAFGFGGPIALVGYMQRDLVERHGWISERQYKEGLALSQLAPGPLAAQLAIYLGWVCGGAFGATLTGVAFVAPSFLMVLALAFAYTHFGGLPWMAGAFYGIGAAVIALIVRSSVKLVRLTLRKDVLLWVLFALTAAATAIAEREIVWLFVACGVTPLLVALARKAAPAPSALSVAPLTATSLALAVSQRLGATALGTAAKLFLFFAGAGLFVFGSGLAIVPFLYGGVVQQFHWLSERQFLDAVAVSMITPGPVVITVAFIGYLVGGMAGAFAAAVGVFLPAFLVVVIVAPHFQRISADARVKAFVNGVTASATGAIAGAAIVLGRRTLVDGTTLLIAGGALLLTYGARRIPEPVVIAAAGMVGVLLAR